MGRVSGFSREVITYESRATGVPFQREDPQYTPSFRIEENQLHAISNSPKLRYLVSRSHSRFFTYSERVNEWYTEASGRSGKHIKQPSAQKVATVAYNRWSLRQCAYYKDCRQGNFVFLIGGRLREVLTIGRRLGKFWCLG